MLKQDRYAVVVNHEEQYTIIPAPAQIPKGFNAVGKEGTKEECLAYVKSVWKGASEQDWKKLVNSLK
jgi:MbtH protein